jgi:hypothetical protein
MQGRGRPAWYERRVLRRAAADGDSSPPGGAEFGLDQVSPVARILIAVIATWVAMVSIPGALPWSGGNDADRAIAIGAAITSIIALICAAATWLDPGQTGREAGWIGLWAALFGLGLAALQVVNILLIPEGAVQGAALGAGLLVLLAFAFLLAWRRRAVLGGEGEGKISNLPLVGSVVGLALIGAFLVLTGELFGRVPGSTAEEWIRYSDLRGSIEALAFAAAGALLGTVIQRSATDREARRADENSEAAGANLALATTAFDMLQETRTALPAARMDTEAAARLSAQIEGVLPLRDHLRLPR